MSRRVDLHVRQIGGNVNIVAGACGGAEFSALAPSYLARSREHIGDRLLTSMMVYAGACAGLDFEKTTPQGRRDTNFRCDCCGALRARRLSRPEVKLIGTNDTDRIALAHDADLSSFRLPVRLGGAMNSGPSGLLIVSLRMLSISAMVCSSSCQPSASPMGES